MGPLYVLPRPDGSKKVKPGLSSFAKKPAEAGPSLQVRRLGTPHASPFVIVIINSHTVVPMHFFDDDRH
jgi:hypothetical protein